MSYIKKNLTHDETIICETRLHWVIFLQPFIWLIITLCLFTIGSHCYWLQFNILKMMPPLYKVFGFITLCFTICIAISTYLTYIATEFSITSRRVFLKVGIIRLSTSEVLLNRIESISITQGFLARLLNYGALLIKSIGGNRDLFTVLPKPAYLHKTIQEQIANKSTTVNNP